MYKICKCTKFVQGRGSPRSLADRSQCFIRNIPFKVSEWKGSKSGVKIEFKGEWRNTWKLGGLNLTIFKNKDDFI